MPQPKSRKIAVLGYRSVGKSSLTIQFVEGQFVDSYDPTIENTFTKTITVSGQEYHLQLVDTAGQDEYSIFPQSYTIDVDGYILLFSVTSYKSFEVVRVIHEKLLDMVGNLQVPIILVGNKKDLHMERVISFEEGRALAESWSAPFLESSAKENQTAVEVFRRMILEVEKMEAGQPPGRTSCLIMRRTSHSCGGWKVGPQGRHGSAFPLASMSNHNYFYSFSLCVYQSPSLSLSLSRSLDQTLQPWKRPAIFRDVQ
ncbi:GTP-binding protein Rheb isoform X1 [Gadus chalcogrammus]|uniref:GTP-binding protein Rheb isoform X1 n=2 Tax=Gadus chalcogrammus TaxID=1042646 RepID=UPI0024C48B02|nr:GTP-binding protein Rheb isoform X1 [Gadus chalcogrammus]